MSKKSTDKNKEMALLQDSFKRVEDLIKQLDVRPNSQVIHGPCARSLLLDAAKIALQCELIGMKDETLA